MRVLLSNFQPFGGHGLNSSHELAGRLVAGGVEGLTFSRIVLPVVAVECIDRLWERVEAEPPDFVLALGQATGAPRIRLEDRGINLDDFPMPDNAGNVLTKTEVVPGGPKILHTTIPLSAMTAALAAEGHKVEHSLSAGAYICNHFYYHLRHRCQPRRLPCLFVHLPLLPEQVPAKAKWPSLAADAQVAALRAIVAACAGTGA